MGGFTTRHHLAFIHQAQDTAVAETSPGRAILSQPAYSPLQADVIEGNTDDEETIKLREMALMEFVS